MPPVRPYITIPDDFPRFIAPGFQRQMDDLRELYWVHFERSSPAATFEDEWLPRPHLWPAIRHGGQLGRNRERWRAHLLSKGMDRDGYVHCHQHISIAHADGWPFPMWKESLPGTWGWHFSLDDVMPGWHETSARDQRGWASWGVRDLGIQDGCWQLEIERPGAWIEPPALDIDPRQAPFIQLRWKARGLGITDPCLQWATPEEPELVPRHAVFFPPAGDEVEYAHIPMHLHPDWAVTAKATRLRVCFGPGARPGARVAVRSLFTTYDTRHHVNNANFISACATYFHWTGDVDFLRRAIPSVRRAMDWMMDACQGLEEKCVVTPFWGHDGRPGFVRGPDGQRALRPWSGIGSNYWDIIPSGQRDAYATIQYHHSLGRLAGLERLADRHPEWDIPRRTRRFGPDRLEAHAREVRSRGNAEFWNPEARRYHLGPDADGRAWDYGFVFINLEAMHYGFATEGQARDILAWLDGRRLVDGDTSQGGDIYHWRFGPRSTTRRNLEYYHSGWAPEHFGWGYQVQDGGCVLGFSHFDLMARLRWLGPDNAAERLAAILEWYGEMMEAGGPREYYRDGTRGTMQGAGTPGGLGIDLEFLESILVPQTVPHGFLGLEPSGGVMAVAPSLPAAFRDLAVTGVHWRNLVFDVRARDEGRVVAVRLREGPDEDARFAVPPGWRLEIEDGRPGRAPGPPVGAVQEMLFQASAEKRGRDRDFRRKIPESPRDEEPTPETTFHESP